MKTTSLLVLLFLISVPFCFGQSQTTMVKLYFPNTKMSNGECAVKVFPVTRMIPKTTAVAKAVLDQLFAGPTAEEKTKGFYSDFTEETKSLLISVNVRNRIAYVNLRDLTAVGSMGNFTTSCGGSNFSGQVETTLKQFLTIKKAVYAIEGKPADFYDWIQVGECPKELKNCDASNFIK